VFKRRIHKTGKSILTQSHGEYGGRLNLGGMIVIASHILSEAIPVSIKAISAASRRDAEFAEEG